MKILEKNKLCRGFRPLVRLALLLVAGSVAATVAAQPAARMGISPDRYDIVFGEGGGDTQSLMIQNLSEEDITITLSVRHWDLDEAGQLRILPPTEQSLDQWIVLNPVRVTVPPGTPQTVRWAIMPRLKPQSGEYRAMLFVEEALDGQTTSGGTRVRMKMRYGLPIYAHVGERIQDATLHGVNVDRDNNRIYLDLANTGNSHGRLAGYYGIWAAADFPGADQAMKQLDRVIAGRNGEAPLTVGQVPGVVLLPGNRRQVAVDVDLAEAGDYIVLLDTEFAGLEITETVSLTQPES